MTSCLQFIDNGLVCVCVCVSGPDMCPPVTPPLCPGNSLCINTLGSFTCVCKHGYYDVSRVVEPQVPSKLICNGTVPVFTFHTPVAIGGTAVVTTC